MYLTYITGALQRISDRIDLKPYLTKEESNNKAYVDTLRQDYYPFEVKNITFQFSK